MARFALRGASSVITDMGLHRAFNGEAWQTQTFIAKADSYEADLASIVSAGMEQLGVTPRGSRRQDHSAQAEPGRNVLGQVRLHQHASARDATPRLSPSNGSERSASSSAKAPAIAAIR